MKDLKSVLEQNKEKYIEELKHLIAIDTHDLGHGIGGGLEKEGQDYLAALLKTMNADEVILDPTREETIRECYEKYQEGNLGHNQENRYNAYGIFKG